MDADQAAPPNPNVVQPSNTVRTHVGSAQTPKRYGKGKKGKLDLSRVDAESMDIDDGVTDEDNIAIKKDSPDSSAAAEDRAEGKGLEEENPNSISEESSPGKKRRSKDIIA